MAETQRIRIFGMKPPCASTERLKARIAKRQEIMLQRSRRYDKPEDFIHHESSDDEEQFNKAGKDFLKTSFNFADYVQSREADIKEIRKYNREFGSRHLLSHDLLREFPVKTENMNKIFCSQWLNSRQVMFGTKCNRLIVYNVATKKSLRISCLEGPRHTLPGSYHTHFGKYSIQINPSRTLLATAAKDNREIAVYRLPTLDAVCVGEKGHINSIYELCWIDDEYLVSGAKDMHMSLWHVGKDLFEASDKEDVLMHRMVRPAATKQCKPGEAIRALLYNASYKELVAYTTNSYIHIWSAETFQQKLSRKLPPRQDNPCLAVHDDTLYAIGCQSNTQLLDARTLHAVKKIPSRHSGCGAKSISFQGSVLTMGTGVGTVTFYDLRAHKYLESSIHSNRTVMLKTSRGFVFPDEGNIDGAQNSKYSPAIYTHCYDASGTRLFCAGGPLAQQTYGNYAGLWQ